MSTLAHAQSDPLHASKLRCEYLVNPLGIGETSPRLSWELASTTRDAMQSAYEIEVASTRDLLDQGAADLWKSGKIVSRDTNQISYAGKPLASREECVWRVRSFDEHDQPSAWSEAATWEMGLLKPEDWQAKWIEAGDARKPEFELINAKFHSIDSDASGDVTDKIKSLLTDNELHIDVNVKTLGVDPAKDHRKELLLTYKLGGRELQYIAVENTRLDLPIGPTALFKTTIKLDRPKRARLFIAAKGVYEARIDGHKVGDSFMNSGYTDFRDRVRYQVYDVTNLGTNILPNILEIRLANGWFAGNIGNHQYHYYGTKPAVIAQLVIESSDGKVTTTSTDETWEESWSPIIAADNMAGEVFDARNEPKYESEKLHTGLVGPGIEHPRLVKAPAIALDPQVAQPVRELMTLPAKSVVEAPKGSGKYVFDFGQNLVGVTRLHVTEKAGTRIELRHAEVANADNTLYTTNLRGASATDYYFCRGDESETYQPTFTYHGFRYVEVTGLSKPPSLDTLTAVVLGSDCPMDGTFECSDPRLNQLQSNIQWGQRGNYLSVPTDCPQRDERQGWTGDAETFIGTAVYNADVAAFFSKWFYDLNDGQSPDGAFPDVAPAVNGAPGTPAWADAGTICPWTIYQTYGDVRTLERCYPHMKAWVDCCEKRSNGFIRDKERGNDFGDWLSNNADTPKDLIGTAFFARSAQIVASAARVLHHDDDAAKYEKLASDIKDAFQKKYVTEDGTIEGDTQTAYAIALAFDLLEGNAKAQAATRLASNVRERDNHLSTGFVGVSHLLPALAENGFADVAYPLLLQDSFPSWLFSVKHGATTIWERWDGWTPEKGFQDPGMNSFNHYSLGSCGQWFYEGICGIRQKAGKVGFRELEIRPVLPPDRGGKPLLTWAKATYTSINGPIVSGWRIADGMVTLDVTIPANCSATVFVPTSDRSSITESGKPVELKDGEVAIGSGTYSFVARR